MKKELLTAIYLGIMHGIQIHYHYIKHTNSVDQETLQQFQSISKLSLQGKLKIFQVV